MHGQSTLSSEIHAMCWYEMHVALTRSLPCVHFVCLLFDLHVKANEKDIFEEKKKKRRRKTYRRSSQRTSDDTMDEMIKRKHTNNLKTTYYLLWLQWTNSIYCHVLSLSLRSHFTIFRFFSGCYYDCCCWCCRCLCFGLSSFAPTSAFIVHIFPFSCINFVCKS